MKSRLRQLAYVTNLPDFEATLQFWTDAYGAGPWFVFDIDLDEAKYRGEPCRTQGRVAMTMLGEGQVEIIAPLSDEARVYTDWMKSHGPIPQAGLFHHFRIDTDDFHAAYQQLLDNGAVDGLVAKAPGGRDVAYVDASATIGSFVEVMKQNPDTLRLMERMREVCDTWDGSEPRRAYVDFIQETLDSAIAGYAAPAN